MRGRKLPWVESGTGGIGYDTFEAIRIDVSF